MVNQIFQGIGVKYCGRCVDPLRGINFRKLYLTEESLSFSKLQGVKDLNCNVSMMVFTFSSYYFSDSMLWRVLAETLWLYLSRRARPSFSTLGLDIKRYLKHTAFHRIKKAFHRLYIAVHRHLVFLVKIDKNIVSTISVLLQKTLCLRIVLSQKTKICPM